MNWFRIVINGGYGICSIKSLNSSEKKSARIEGVGKSVMSKKAAVSGKTNRDFSHSDGM